MYSQILSNITLFAQSPLLMKYSFEIFSDASGWEATCMIDDSVGDQRRVSSQRLRVKSSLSCIDMLCQRSPRCLTED